MAVQVKGNEMSASTTTLSNQVCNLFRLRVMLVTLVSALLSACSNSPLLWGAGSTHSFESFKQLSMFKHIRFREIKKGPDYVIFADPANELSLAVRLKGKDEIESIRITPVIESSACTKDQTQSMFKLLIDFLYGDGASADTNPDATFRTDIGGRTAQILSSEGLILRGYRFAQTDMTYGTTKWQKEIKHTGLICQSEFASVWPTDINELALVMQKRSRVVKKILTYSDFENSIMFRVLRCTRLETIAIPGYRAYIDDENKIAVCLQLNTTGKITELATFFLPTATDINQKDLQKLTSVAADFMYGDGETIRNESVHMKFANVFTQSSANGKSHAIDSITGGAVIGSVGGIRLTLNSLSPDATDLNKFRLECVTPQAHSMEDFRAWARQAGYSVDNANGGYQPNSQGYTSEDTTAFDSNTYKTAFDSNTFNPTVNKDVQLDSRKQRVDDIAKSSDKAIEVASLQRANDLLKNRIKDLESELSNSNDQVLALRKNLDVTDVSLRNKSDELTQMVNSLALLKNPKAGAVHLIKREDKKTNGEDGVSEALSSSPYYLYKLDLEKRLRKILNRSTRPEGTQFPITFGVHFNIARDGSPEEVCLEEHTAVEDEDSFYKQVVNVIKAAGPFRPPGTPLSCDVKFCENGLTEEPLSITSCDITPTQVKFKSIE